MGRATQATWQLGTILEHQALQPDVVVGAESGSLAYFAQADRLRAGVGEATAEGQALLDAIRRGVR